MARKTESTEGPIQYVGSFLSVQRVKRDGKSVTLLGLHEGNTKFVKELSPLETFGLSDALLAPIEGGFKSA